MKKKSSTFVVEKHNLIPKHTICSDKETSEILAQYKATLNEIPKILANDSGIATLKAKVGDLIKIERNDLLVGKTYFYRVVVNE